MLITQLANAHIIFLLFLQIIPANIRDITGIHVDCRKRSRYRSVVCFGVKMIESEERNQDIITYLTTTQSHGYTHGRTIQRDEAPKVLAPPTTANLAD